MKHLKVKIVHTPMSSDERNYRLREVFKILLSKPVKKKNKSRH